MFLRVPLALWNFNFEESYTVLNCFSFNIETSIISDGISFELSAVRFLNKKKINGAPFLYSLFLDSSKRATLLLSTSHGHQLKIPTLVILTNRKLRNPLRQAINYFLKKDFKKFGGNYLKKKRRRGGKVAYEIGVRDFHNLGSLEM